MPTEVGDLTGRPSPARVSVRAVRMTLSNGSSLDYSNLYCPLELKFPPFGWERLVPGGMARAYDFRRFLRRKVTAAMICNSTWERCD
jgi:hypothetical protein